MENLFADRMRKIHYAYVNEILEVTEKPAIISFAGGLPNSTLFPIAELADAAQKVLMERGQTVLQYAPTQGFLPLREWIAERYRKTAGLQVSAEEIIITNGSQQSFDLTAKTFLNRGDGLVVERPCYHGAILSYSMHQPTFWDVTLHDYGIDIPALNDALGRGGAKMFYAVPNFQNPSGWTYSMKNRQQIADVLATHGKIMVEDDPYGAIRFAGEDLPPIKSLIPDNTVLLGTFSKTISPGLRVGWACARKEIIQKMVVAKQASDVHTDFLAQQMVHRYLIEHDLDQHIAKLKVAYRHQCDLMLSTIAEHIPAEVEYTKPEGGMFIWMTLPEGVSSVELFKMAAEENVVFVPGGAFHLNGQGDNTLRLSFSISDEERIGEGMRRLGVAMRKLLAKR